MTSKEIGELRRRMRPDRTNMTAVRGFYISSGGEVLSSFRQSVALMRQEDKESYLAIFRRVLSGAQDKNLIDLSFRTSQVADSDEHRLLMALRDSGLDDEAALETFCQTVTGALSSEDHYLILLAHERYDVPFKAKDGAQLDDSSEVFSYVLCAICPVKPGKAALRYIADEKEFHNQGGAYTVGAPELGFLFPAFDNRSANIYNALFYSRKEGELHQEFIDAVFHTDLPMSAAEQREAFEAALSESLGSACSLEIVQAIHGQLAAMIEEHRETKDPEPLTVSPCEVSKIILDCGASEEQSEAFQAACGERFGAGAVLNPANLIDAKKVELKTEKVSLSIDPEYSHLVEAKVIDGQKVLIVPVEDHLEFNGVAVNVNKDKE